MPNMIIRIKRIVTANFMTFHPMMARKIITMNISQRGI